MRKDTAPAAVIPAKISHSIGDAAVVSGIGRTTIYEQIREGRLTARKIGRRTVILDVDLRAWLAALPTMRGAA